MKKVITKSVINMTTLETTYEESYFYDGLWALCGKGGGGNAGEISFPTYMETFHQEMLDDTATDTLDFSVVDFANAAWGAGGNPYDGEDAYDPSTQLAATQSRLSVLGDKVDELSEEDDWERLIDAAITKVDSVVLDDTEIEAQVDAFEVSAQNKQLRSINRMTGSMMDINAVVSSAFPIAMALLETDTNASVNQFEQNLRLQNKNLRYKFIVQGVTEMLNALRSNVDAGARLTGMTSDVNRLEVIAKVEEKNQQLNLETREALWDFEVMAMVGNTMAAIHGAPSSVKPPELGVGASVLSGAAAGAAIGSGVPVVGTGVGAGVGAAIGLLDSL